MIRIAHIVHPVIVDPSSDLVVAQTITFATMGFAKEFAKQTVDVDLVAVQYHDEERVPLPDCFVRTPDLQRSITDIIAFKSKRRLALIKDILDSLYEINKNDFFIYTNVDIALQPYFYSTAASIIQQGYEAFVINRRTVSNTYSSLQGLPLMYADLGEKHNGWDCFIFHRSLYPDFDLGSAIIGTGWFGRVMITNMACLSNRFKVFEDLHLTFHIGNDKIWQAHEYEEYLHHNRNECGRILVKFNRTKGPLNRSEIPGRFMLNFE